MTPKRILLVDDANTILMMERMILDKEGYDLDTATDGQEAIAKVLARPPDLILLDVVMPKMNGFEVCRHLREQDATKDIPIIMVTTRGEAEKVETGFQSGCSDYITKPINSLELRSKVRNYLGE